MNVRGPKGDVYGKVLCRTFLILQQLGLLINFFNTKLNCVLWRIKIGTGAQFYGSPSWHRAPDSTILIGNKCRFRSDMSNRIGGHRPCMISTFKAGAKITIGDNCGFSGTVIGSVKEISIGSNVICGVNTTIVDTDSHNIDFQKRHCTNNIGTAKVCIEDDVWLCMNVVVLKGVTIGRGSVIAANSVVTHSIPPGVLAAGIPAKVVRNIR